MTTRIRDVHITPRPEAVEAQRPPYLWGRNGYARLARVTVAGWPALPRVAMPPTVDLAAFSKRSDDSPCHLSDLSPDDARAIGRALLAAADAAEGVTP